jgi:hypothetical protein
MEELDNLKNQGNEYFKMGSYESALETYLACLDMVLVDSKDQKDNLNEETEIRTTVRSRDR